MCVLMLLSRCWALSLRRGDPQWAVTESLLSVYAPLTVIAALTSGVPVVRPPQIAIIVTLAVVP